MEEKKKKTGLWVALIVAAALFGGICGAAIQSAVTAARQNALEAERLLQPKALSPSEIYDRTVSAVVGISTEKTDNIFGREAVAASSGTGFVLSEDGYVMTNAHVVEKAEEVTVSLYDGRELEAEVVAFDEETDIALLKVQAQELTAVTIGDPRQLQVGEQVFAIGNPLGELTFSMTGGILSALDREINQSGYPQKMLQIDAAINVGNSGGPLFDIYGSVIGVTTSKYTGMSSSGSTLEGLGFAIPIDEAVKVAEDLKLHGRVRGRPYLGVSVAVVNEELASIMECPPGLLISECEPGSAADRAGIRQEDILFRMDGQEVLNTTDFLAIVNRHRAGEELTVTVFREEEELELIVTLDEKPADRPEKEPAFISNS